MIESEELAMTEERFEELVAAYGADPLRWPETERTAAIEFANSGNPRAATLLQEAQTLDGLLFQAAAPALSAETIATMHRQARPGTLARLHRILDWPGPLWQPAGALTAALLFGAVLGWSNPDDVVRLASLTIDSVVAETIEVQPGEDPFGEDAL